MKKDTCMIDFSIIIPIYNVQDFLAKCLNSVMNQTFSSFECLLICDYSTDNSKEIAYEYAKKDIRFKVICKSNTGLSIARNIGIDNAKGKYLLFLDGDDYYDEKLLETLNSTIVDEDLIRFQVREIRKDDSIDWNQDSCEGKGTEVFNKIVDYHYVENAWAYCYNSDFFKKNNFKFMEKCIAEDYGLIPLIIAKANKVKVLSFIGYNYVQRNNSMMSTTNYSKHIRKMEDMITQAKFLYNELNNIKNNNTFMSFINNSLIYYSTTLEKKDYKKFNRILHQMNAYDYLPRDSFKHKIKSWIIKNNSYLFYNYLARFL